MYACVCVRVMPSVVRVYWCDDDDEEEEERKYDVSLRTKKKKLFLLLYWVIRITEISIVSLFSPEYDHYALSLHRTH